MEILRRTLQSGNPRQKGFHLQGRRACAQAKASSLLGRRSSKTSAGIHWKGDSPRSAAYSPGHGLPLWSTPPVEVLHTSTSFHPRPTRDPPMIHPTHGVTERPVASLRARRRTTRPMASSKRDLVMAQFCRTERPVASHGPWRRTKRPLLATTTQLANATLSWSSDVARAEMVVIQYASTWRPVTNDQMYSCTYPVFSSVSISFAEP